MKKWLWISGWGIPPAWFSEIVTQAIPDGTHRVIPPGPNALHAIKSETFDHLGGFSLGAFLLLQNAENLSAPALLLSPFFGYTSEMECGGKIRKTQIRYLARSLQRQPLAALADFYERINLPIPPPDELPYPLEDLLWGLDTLANQQLPPGLPQNWTGLIGSSDPLLDAKQIKKQEPSLTIVPDAGHDPAALLRAWTLENNSAS